MAPYLLVFAALSGPASSGRIFWVSPSGDDTSTGSQKAPWKSPALAVNRAAPGDTIRFMGGTYSVPDFVTIEKMGSSERWLTLEAVPGENPVFDFGTVQPQRQPWSGGFHLKGASYIRLVGLTIQNSHACGILATEDSSYIDIVDCKTHMTFMPGIGVWNSHNVRIVGNEVTKANDPKMRLWGDPKTECPHEAISIAGVKGFEAAWNHVHDSVKEGIDVKEVSAHGVVHHNLVEDLDRQAYYADAWFGLLEDVEFFSNVARRCEWGLVISVEGRDSELQNVRIHHNILHDNRGSGVFFGRWGTDGLRKRIHIHHNTIVRNGRNGHWAGATGNIDVRSNNVEDLAVDRNLLISGGAFQMATFAEPGAAREAHAGFRITAKSNHFDRRFSKYTDENSPYGPVYPWYGEKETFGQVSFVDESKGDYRMAANAGDFGAFPKGAAKLPAPAKTLAGFPPYQPRRKLHFGF